MILLVSGIPASGKSTYCRWLAEEKEFLHFDIDHRQFKGTGVDQQWEGMFRPTGSVEPFLATIRQWLRSVAVDWGFPPAKLGVVSDFKEEGVDLWWFDADKTAARKKYVERGGQALGAFDAQVSSIEKAWPFISELVCDHIITTLNPNGKYMAPQQIFLRMFGPVSHSSLIA
jgi:hypothetical protein